MHDAGPTGKTDRTRRHGATALAAAVVANIALAFGPLFVRVSDVGPVAAGFWRLTLAVPVLLVLAFARGGQRLRDARGLWIVLIVAGLAFAADLASWHVGIIRTTLANATLFGNSTILIFPIYGFIAMRQWPSRTQALALVLAAAGGALLMGRSAELSSRHIAGDLFCVLAGILYTVYFVCMTRARARLSPLAALSLATLASVLPLLILSLSLGEQVMPDNWWPLIALAGVSQVLGQGCMIYALVHLSPLVVGITLLIQPVVSAALGWIYFGEALAGADAVGAVLVAAALVLVRQGAGVAPARRPATAE